MKTNKGIAPILGAVIILAIIVGSVFAYVFLVPMLNMTPTTGEVFYGDIGITIAEINLLDLGASVTSTSDSYKFFSSGGTALASATEADFVSGKSFTVGTEKTVTLYPEDNGIFWLYADPGTDFFISPTKTVSENTEFVSYEKIDVDGDNNLEYVFEVDVSNARVDPEPSREYSMILVEEATPTLNSPVDQDATGTGTKTGKVEWQLSIAEMKGIRLARVYLSSNETTFQSLIDLTSVSITGVSVDGIDVDTNWQIDINVNNYREPLDCHLLMMEEDPDISYVAITIKWESYFASADEAVDVTLNVVTMGADESTDTAITDTISIGG